MRMTTLLCILLDILPLFFRSLLLLHMLLFFLLLILTLG